MRLAFSVHIYMECLQEYDRRKEILICLPKWSKSWSVYPRFLIVNKSNLYIPYQLQKLLQLL